MHHQILHSDYNTFCNFVKLLQNAKNGKYNLYIESGRFVIYDYQTYTKNCLMARLTSFDLIDKKDCEGIVRLNGNNPLILTKSNNFNYSFHILHIQLYLEYLDGVKRIEDNIRNKIIPVQIKCVSEFLPDELVRIVEFYFAQIY
jgi:hypothetical protein